MDSQPTSLSEFLPLSYCPAAANLKLIPQCCCPGLCASNPWQQWSWTTPQTLLSICPDHAFHPCIMYPHRTHPAGRGEDCPPGVLGTHFAACLQGWWMTQVESSLVSPGQPWLGPAPCPASSSAHSALWSLKLMARGLLLTSFPKLNSIEQNPHLPPSSIYISASPGRSGQSPMDDFSSRHCPVPPSPHPTSLLRSF